MRPQSPPFRAVRGPMQRQVLPLAVLCLAALLSACASAPQQNAAPAQGTTAAAPAKEQVCRRELPTGMRIPITVCRFVDDMKERTDSDRAWAERIPTEVPDVR